MTNSSSELTFGPRPHFDSCRSDLSFCCAKERSTQTNPRALENPTTTGRRRIWWGTKKETVQTKLFYCERWLRRIWERCHVINLTHTRRVLAADVSSWGNKYSPYNIYVWRSELDSYGVYLNIELKESHMKTPLRKDIASASRWE